MVRPTYLAAALEPYKQELLRKTDRGFTLEMLKLWLQTKGINSSTASIAKYLRTWGVIKRLNKDDTFQALLKEGFKSKLEDKDLIESMKAAGYDISRRNLRRERIKQGFVRKYTKSRFSEVQQELEDFIRSEIRAGRMQNLGIRATKAYCAERGFMFSRRLIGQILQSIDPEGIASRTPLQCRRRGDPPIDPALQSVAPPCERQSK